MSNNTTTAKGTTTTYVVRVKGQIVDTRTSGAGAKNAYTHAVVAFHGEEPRGARSYHNSEVLARKAINGYGTPEQGWTYRAVPVEAHKGSKATVLKRLAAAAEQPATKASTKAPAKGKAASKAPAKGKASTDVKRTKAEQMSRAAKKTTPPTSPVKGVQHPGAVFLALMEKAGTSQTKTATTMGVAPMTLNRLCNGHGIPTAKVTVAFAKAVGADPREVWAAVAEYELALALAEAKGK